MVNKRGITANLVKSPTMMSKPQTTSNVEMTVTIAPAEMKPRF